MKRSRKKNNKYKNTFKKRKYTLTVGGGENDIVCYSDDVCSIFNGDTKYNSDIMVFRNMDLTIKMKNDKVKNYVNIIKQQLNNILLKESKTEDNYKDFFKLLIIHENYYNEEFQPNVEFFLGWGIKSMTWMPVMGKTGNSFDRKKNYYEENIEQKAVETMEKLLKGEVPKLTEAPAPAPAPPPAAGAEPEAEEPDNYVEKQQSLGCGRHALNNLFKKKMFIRHNSEVKRETLLSINTPMKSNIPLNTICNILKSENLWITGTPDEIKHCPDNENYNIEILKIGLSLAGYNVQDRSEGISNKDNKDNFLGYLINLNKGHWICIRKNKTNFTLVDSTDHTIEDPTKFHVKPGQTGKHFIDSDNDDLDKFKSVIESNYKSDTLHYYAVYKTTFENKIKIMREKKKDDKPEEQQQYADERAAEIKQEREKFTKQLKLRPEFKKLHSLEQACLLFICYQDIDSNNIFKNINSVDINDMNTIYNMIYKGNNIQSKILINNLLIEFLKDPKKLEIKPNKKQNLPSDTLTKIKKMIQKKYMSKKGNIPDSNNLHINNIFTIFEDGIIPILNDFTNNLSKEQFLPEIKKHISNRFDWLKKKANLGKTILIPGKFETGKFENYRSDKITGHQLGYGFATYDNARQNIKGNGGQWGTEGLKEESNEFIKFLNTQVKELTEISKTNIIVNVVKEEEAKKYDYVLWGANITNYCIPGGYANGGGGLATTIKKEAFKNTITLGIITTPYLYSFVSTEQQINSTSKTIASEAPPPPAKGQTPALRARQPPARGQPAREQPASEQTARGQPASEQTAREQPPRQQPARRTTSKRTNTSTTTSKTTTSKRTPARGQTPAPPPARQQPAPSPAREQPAKDATQLERGEGRPGQAPAPAPAPASVRGEELSEKSKLTPLIATGLTEKSILEIHKFAKKHNLLTNDNVVTGIGLSGLAGILSLILI